MTDTPQRIQKIVHQHVHDARNSINCLQLEFVWLEHLANEPEIAATVTRMRVELAELEAALEFLQVKFSNPKFSIITVEEFMELWKARIAPLESAAHLIAWSPMVSSAILNLDADAILSVLREIIKKAWQCAEGKILKAGIEIEEDRIMITVREPSPRVAMAVDALDEARHIVEMNGGTLCGEQDILTCERVIMMTFAAERQALEN